MSSDGRRGRISLLWNLVRPHRVALIGAMVLGLLVSALELMSPLVTRDVLDALGGQGDLLTPVLILVALLVVGGVTGWWQWLVLGRLAEDIVFDARGEMLRRYLRARVFPLLRQPPGELVTRVTSDTLLLREATSSSAVGIINAVVMLVGTLVLMAVLDVPLALVTIASIAAVGLAFAVLMPAIATEQERAQGALGALATTLGGTVRAIKTVKVANAEERQLDILLGHARAARDHGISVVRREALVWTIAGAGIQGAIIAILGIGAWRVSLGETTVSTLVAFLLYAFGLLGPISELGTHLTTLQAGIAAASRIREIDALEPEERTVTPGIGAQGADVPALELDGVTARYRPGGAPVVEDLSLTIPHRGHTAIVGPSGAGKTSIFSLLLFFLEPERGEVRLNGTAYRDLGTTAVRERMMYVEQEAPLIPGTLRENLLFNNQRASSTKVSAVLERLRLDGLLRQLDRGLDTPLLETDISGGQRQRIAIARGLLADPQILLLDEATAQVDGISEAAIHVAIRSQARRGAVVTIAHRLSTVVDADTIVVMDAGRIVAQGTHEHLLGTSDLYRRLVDTLGTPDE